MSHALERSISLYRHTSGPLRCLSDRDPCILRGALQRPRRETSELKQPAEAKPCQNA